MFIICALEDVLLTNRGQLAQKPFLLFPSAGKKNCYFIPNVHLNCFYLADMQIASPWDRVA